MAPSDQLMTWRDGIVFIFQRASELDSIGDLTFFDVGPNGGHVAFGNQVRHYQESFECQFAEGFIARSPGLVREQKLTMLIDGGYRTVVWEHHREVGVPWFGYRPVIEVETPTGEFWHFSYRAGLFGNFWCRLIPLTQRVPYGYLGIHFVRVLIMLFDLVLVLIVFSVRAGFWTALLAALLLTIGFIGASL
jgi:hypothetical protein